MTFAEVFNRVALIVIATTVAYIALVAVASNASPLSTVKCQITNESDFTTTLCMAHATWQENV